MTDDTDTTTVSPASAGTERDLCALLLTAVDGPPGKRFRCGHLYAHVTLAGGVMPAIAVYSHTLTTREPPRIIDFRTANMLAYLLRRHHDMGKVRTERYPGSLADWHVTHDHPTDDADADHTDP